MAYRSYHDHGAETAELEQFKNVLRDTVERVGRTVEKLREDREEYEIKRQELDQMEQLVQEQMDEVSRIRESLEAERNASRNAPKGLFGACCRPSVAREVDVDIPS